LNDLFFVGVIPGRVDTRKATFRFAEPLTEVAVIRKNRNTLTTTGNHKQLESKMR